MNVDVFIRSYSNDFLWLEFALESLVKNLHGVRDVVVAVPLGQEPIVNLMMGRTGIMKKYPTSRVCGWPAVGGIPGYFDQQLCKLHADTYCSADYICHMDSDTVMTRTVHVSDFFIDNKPVHPYVSHAAIIRSGHTTPWQAPTERFLGQPVPMEYMRRQMIVYPRDVYAALRKFCADNHHCTIIDYVREVVKAQATFSEFNALGGFCHYHHRDKFIWQDCEQTDVLEYIVLLGIKQYWSWGGLTPAIQAEIRELLDKPKEKAK